VGGGVAGEALHDGLEAGGVGADELCLDELHLNAGVLVPPGAMDLHRHALVPPPLVGAGLVKLYFPVLAIQANVEISKTIKDMYVMLTHANTEPYSSAQRSLRSA
jgi:hypothetical protein